jgi:hypothetical protein
MPEKCILATGSETRLFGMFEESFGKGDSEGLKRWKY